MLADCVFREPALNPGVPLARDADSGAPAPFAPKQLYDVT